MLLVNQIKLHPGYTKEDLYKKTASILKVFVEDIEELNIEKISIDARKKPDIYYIISVTVVVKNENSVLRRITTDHVSPYLVTEFTPQITGTITPNTKPIIVGAGPCGLFAAYFLAKFGYNPIVLERGYDIESRTHDVEDFFKTGRLKPNSNVQFGEGGAGAFSDGKLNTLVKDKFGRNKEVLKIFVECGADPDILTDAKPHIGTDILLTVVKNMREKIKEMGGEFRFNAEVTDIKISDGHISSLIVNQSISIPCDICVLAIGHSARNTFEMLYKNGIEMEQKDFAIGLRVEHPQEMINEAMYGPDREQWKKLPVASYKLTYQASNNRGVYSFCMCPGGYVVNASSEENRTCVNGMSYKARDSKHANSAIIVTVNSKDFGGDSPLDGIEFQRRLEEKAYSLGKGSIPVQFYSDFKREVKTGLSELTDIDPGNMLKVLPECRGSYSYSHVSEIMPIDCNEAFVEGIEYFDKIIPGFASDSMLVSGIESRTSSPVRIVRNEDYESINLSGLYPAGEGAGYAGGIMSAAMDGIKVFEAIAGKYRPLE